MKEIYFKGFMEATDAAERRLAELGILPNRKGLFDSFYLDPEAAKGFRRWGGNPSCPAYIDFKTKLAE